LNEFEGKENKGVFFINDPIEVLSKESTRTYIFCKFVACMLARQRISTVLLSQHKHIFSLVFAPVAHGGRKIQEKMETKIFIS